MEKFKTYIFLTSLTLLFILAGGILGAKSGIVLTILISSAVHIYIYYYKKEQICTSKEKSRETKSRETNNDDAIAYAIVERLVKRTDLSLPLV